MKYINRDKTGTVQSIFNTQQYEGQEALIENHVDLLNFDLGVLKTTKKGMLKRQAEENHLAALFAASPKKTDLDTALAEIDAASDERAVNAVRLRNE